MRSVADLDKLIVEWESLRADYTARGSSGIVNFIIIEIRKLEAERRSVSVAQSMPRPMT